jgi:hypothetical protein
LIERDAVEQNFHIENGIDGHPGLAHIANNARMIGIIPAVGGEIKGHRKAFLAGGKVAAVKGIALFGGGKTGILPYCPWAHGIHGRIGTAKKWR